MNCFTVVERTILDGITAVNGGIGMEGKLATITDGTHFPKPEILEEIQEVNDRFPYMMPSRFFIRNADYYQFRSNKTGQQYTPIIFGDENDQSGSALVLWFTKISGPNIFENPILTKAKIISGPTLLYGFNQYLFLMENDNSSVFARTDTKYLFLNYNDGKLGLQVRN
jgi:hypothetical protein